MSPEERRVRVSDMIAVGRLRPGALLHANYFGQRHTAELLADGTVRYRSQVYGSPSAAGAAVKVVVHGPNVSDTTTATDGLDFWHTEDAVTGDVASLKEIRRRTVSDSNR